MNPRRFLNLLRSPTGALLLFLLGLTIALVMINSRRETANGSAAATPPPKPGSSQQLAQIIERDMSPYNPPSPNEKPGRAAAAPSGKQESPPALPPISLFQETPSQEREPKKLSAQFAPFGRLIPCELVITVDSSSISTPIVGLVIEDIFHHGQLIIPAGTEVHGTAQVDRARERIASEGRWTLVWQNGEELNVSGLALDHEREADTSTWAITDGSAGLRGRLIKSDNLAEVKLYVAALLSGAADAFTQRQTTALGSFVSPSLENAPLTGAKSVLDRYAQQIMDTIERDGFYVRVPAGKQFYLYVTQTLDEADARIGGAAIQTAPPEEEAGHRTPPAAQLTPNTPPSFRQTMPSLRSTTSYASQYYLTR